MILILSYFVMVSANRSLRCSVALIAVDATVFSRKLFDFRLFVNSFIHRMHLVGVIPSQSIPISHLNFGHLDD